MTRRYQRFRSIVSSGCSRLSPPSHSTIVYCSLIVRVKRSRSQKTSFSVRPSTEESESGSTERRETGDFSFPRLIAHPVVQSRCEVSCPASRENVCHPGAFRAPSVVVPIGQSRGRPASSRLSGHTAGAQWCRPGHVLEPQTAELAYDAVLRVRYT